MDLGPYIDQIHHQLEVAAEAGGEEARALGERLAAPLDAAIRLSLLHALSAAAQEITCDLAPGSVELRLRDRNPEFAVTPPLAPPAPTESAEPAGHDPAAVPGAYGDGRSGAGVAADDGAMARINLRMPDHLKARVDHAAAADGISVNAWLVRAAAASLERAEGRRPERGGAQGPQRFTGWAR